VAGVEVEWIADETGWSPYITLNDAFKLDNVILHGRRLFLNSVGFDPRFPDFFLEIVEGRIVPEKTEFIEPGIA
jgi:hypothetical protein